MRKTIIIFPLFFVLILISSFLITSVKATDYEWIQDGSFELESQTDLLSTRNAGFENGTDNWVIGGGMPTITDSEKHTGFYSAYFEGAGSCYRNTLQTVILGSDIVTFGAWFKGSGSNGYWLRVEYNDTSNDNMQGVGIGAWQNVDAISIINPVKFVQAILVGQYAGSGYQDYFCDDVYLTISSGGENPYWQTLTNYAGFTDAEANSGLKSGYIIKKSDFSATLYQDIPYLSTDNITEVSLYAKTNSASNVTISVTLLFSGIGEGQGALLKFTNFWINSTSDWTFFDYNLWYISDGKIVTKFMINIFGGDENSYVYIDDVSLKATVEYGTIRFSWYPIPDTEYDIDSFNGYVLQDYVFYCTIYDFDGNPTEEGAFTVSITSGNIEMGDNGIIVNGQFWFVVRARTNQYIYQTETIKIQTITPSGAYTFNIYVLWFPNPLIFPEPVPTPDSGFGATGINNLVYFTIYFIELLCPALCLAFAMNQKGQDPVLGLIIGFMFSGMISYLVGMDLWVLVVCIIAIGVLVFGKGRGYV